MTPDPLLYIIASVADGFELAHFPWSDAANAKISINRAKFENLEMVEVIIDAMPFLLARLTPVETRQLVFAIDDQALAAETLSPNDSAISVAFSENLSSAKHLPEVNQRLLLLGLWIGDSLDASAAVWMPSRTIMRFANFRGTMAKYPDQGPMHYSDS